jgi:hypothetical protein
MRATRRSIMSETALAIPTPTEGPPALTDEAVTLQAVEILRGTNYDFRIEATVDVVNLFGPHVLVGALERLDAEIEPRERSVSRSSSE